MVAGIRNNPRMIASHNSSTQPGSADKVAMAPVTDFRMKLAAAPNAATLNPPASSISEPLPSNALNGPDGGAAAGWPALMTSASCFSVVVKSVSF
ncbi:hypothetical protein SDC9_130250 [bioreactor metagenome]|uniref:Uncharacterized protein n=1 Tax=bioreactor metagenome TaxID=1076179 RepID=A0A645D210_9ZZZZ